MSGDEWLRAPIGIDASRWISRPGCRTVLVVTHSLVSCQRLLDVVDYVESDPRIQVVFTVGPDTFNHEVAGYVERLGALVLSWRQATMERFDLALAASYGGLAELHAPLVVTAHGAGHAKPVRPWGDGGPLLTHPPVYGLDAQRLTRDGRVLPSALLLSHDRDRGVLRRQCPQALPVAVVVGDPCFDRLVASLPWRRRYRHALRVAKRQKLVVVSSTWGRDGLFGHVPDLLPWTLSELPAGRFRVAALLHPAVWSAHGPRQVRAWLRECRRAGLILLDPEQDWRALLVAADYVIGDHGSVTAYAAGIGRPVLRLAGPDPGVAQGTAQHLVFAGAGQLDPGRPLEPQLANAATVDRRLASAALTSRPGQAARLIRSAVYRILRLDEPGRHRRVEPVPAPRPTPSWVYP